MVVSVDIVDIALPYPYIAHYVRPQGYGKKAKKNAYPSVEGHMQSMQIVVLVRFLRLDTIVRFPERGWAGWAMFVKVPVRG